MSRVGKNPVAVPEGVDVSVSGALLVAKGKLGEVTVPLHEAVDLKVEKDVVTVVPLDQSKLARSLWGTIRSLVNSAVTGVSVGFTKKLEINGLKLCLIYRMLSIFIPIMKLILILQVKI